MMLENDDSTHTPSPLVYVATHLFCGALSWRGLNPIKAYITIAIPLRYDYDEKLTRSFFARVESRRMEAGARDTS